jgi:hypothetical protein
LVRFFLALSVALTTAFFATPALGAFVDLEVSAVLVVRLLVTVFFAFLAFVVGAALRGLPRRGTGRSSGLLGPRLPALAASGCLLASCLCHDDDLPAGASPSREPGSGKMRGNIVPGVRAVKPSRRDPGPVRILHRVPATAAGPPCIGAPYSLRTPRRVVQTCPRRPPVRAAQSYRQLHPLATGPGEKSGPCRSGGARSGSVRRDRRLGRRQASDRNAVR